MKRDRIWRLHHGKWNHISCSKWDEGPRLPGSSLQYNVPPLVLRPPNEGDPTVLEQVDGRCQRAVVGRLGLSSSAAGIFGSKSLLHVCSWSASHPNEWRYIWGLRSYTASGQPNYPSCPAAAQWLLVESLRHSQRQCSDLGPSRCSKSKAWNQDKSQGLQILKTPGLRQGRSLAWLGSATAWYRAIMSAGRWNAPPEDSEGQSDQGLDCLHPEKRKRPKSQKEHKTPS